MSDTVALAAALEQKIPLIIPPSDPSAIKPENGNFQLVPASAGVGGAAANGAPTMPVKKERLLRDVLKRRRPVDIEFTDLTCTVSSVMKKEKKTILKGVSGKFRSGQLIAIMGPSGAGKTTLMSTLAGYKLTGVSGSVMVNGFERNLRRFRRLSCYIMQDDALLPQLTPIEAMTIAAALKIGPKVPVEKRQTIVTEVLNALGLGTCENTKSGNLSGGQRKRLCTGLELVNNPSVMFFDEPTSGLDSSSCFGCISLLRGLAHGGRTIICTIHQPSARIFEMFDQIYLLGDGDCIYRGSPTNLVSFLGEHGLSCPSYHNPADFVIEVASGEYGDVLPCLAAAVRAGKCGNEEYTGGDITPADVTQDELNVTMDSQDGKNNLPLWKAVLMKKTNYDPDYHSETGFAAPFWYQFKMLLYREFICTLRNPMLTHLRISVSLIVGVIIGLLYFQLGKEASRILNNVSLQFAGHLFIMLTTLLPTVLTFPLEMPVITREHLNCWYSIKAYYIAKTTADIPVLIIYPILLSTVIYFMSAQPPETFRYMLVTGCLIAMSLTCQGHGVLIGALFSVQEAVFAAGTSTIPLLVFCGFLVNYSAMPVYMAWLSYLSYLRYAMQISLQAIYGYGREPIACSLPFCFLKNPEKVLQLTETEDVNVPASFGALLLIALLLRVAGVYALRYKVKSQR